MVPMWPNESCEVCSNYLMRICGTTMDENVLLKSMTFLCRMLMGILCCCCFYCNVCVVVCYCKMCHSFVVLLLYLGLILVGTLIFILNVGYLQMMCFLGIVWLCPSVQLISHEMCCYFVWVFLYQVQWKFHWRFWASFINLYRHMGHLFSRKQGFKQCTEFLFLVLRVKVMIETYCSELWHRVGQNIGFSCNVLYFNTSALALTETAWKVCYRMDKSGFKSEVLCPEILHFEGVS